MKTRTQIATSMLTALTGIMLLGTANAQAKEITEWFEDETIAFPSYEPYYFEGKIDIKGTLKIESRYPEGKFASGKKQDFYHNPVVYGDSYSGFKGIRPMDIKGMYVTWDDASKRLLRVEIVFNKFHRDSFESLFINTDYDPEDKDDWDSWNYFVNTDCYGRNKFSDGAGNLGPNRDIPVNSYKGGYGGSPPSEGVYMVKQKGNKRQHLKGYTFSEDRTVDGTNYGWLSPDSIALMGRLRHPNGIKTSSLKLVSPVPDYFYYAKKVDNNTGREIKQPEDNKVYENMSIIYDLVCDQARDKTCHPDKHALRTTDIYRPLTIILKEHFIIGFTTRGAYDVILAKGSTIPQPR